MPTQSVLVREFSFLTRVLQQYLSLLKKYPIITKSVTRSVYIFVKANVSWLAVDLGKFTAVIYKAVLYPFFFISHYIYQLLEVLLPTTVPYCLIKRLLLERLIFAPAFLLLFYVVMNALEGKTLADVQNKLKTSYWPAMKMNWKVWTPFQFININYVPVQVLLFANLVALFWYAYLASVRK
uniref:Peroxisomal membrane protein 2 n=1 Tax=Sinocyclocheilus rhinocerous TaxID=307959 RepID=A0A673GWG1_9TELE